jgi:hypothetical protein
MIPAGNSLYREQFDKRIAWQENATEKTTTYH